MIGTIKCENCTAWDRIADGSPYGFCPKLRTIIQLDGMQHPITERNWCCKGHRPKEEKNGHKK